MGEWSIHHNNRACYEVVLADLERTRVELTAVIDTIRWLIEAGPRAPHPIAPEKLETPHAK